MKKLTVILLTLTLLAALLTGCGTSPSPSASTPAASTPGTTPTGSPSPDVPASEQPDDVTVRVAALKGPTAMGMVKMISDDAAQSAPVYDFTLAGAADELTVKLQGGTVDIAAIPCNLASVLYNKLEGGIKVIAVNTLGVLYLLDTTGEIDDIDDLRGKTVYSTGQGTTPEFALNYILEQNGLIPGTDVTVEFRSEATELGALLAAGQVELCVLPQPYVTSVLAANENAQIALSLTDEWNRVQPEFNLLTGCVVVRTAFLQEHGAAVDAFLETYSDSIDFINNNVAEGAALVAEFEIVGSAAAAEKAIPECNIVFISGQELKAQLSGYLSVLHAANPASVGGQLPDDAFYYQP